MFSKEAVTCSCRANFGARRRRITKSEEFVSSLGWKGINLFPLQTVVLLFETMIGRTLRMNES